MAVGAEPGTTPARGLPRGRGRRARPAALGPPAAHPPGLRRPRLSRHLSARLHFGERRLLTGMAGSRPRQTYDANRSDCDESG